MSSAVSLRPLPEGSSRETRPKSEGDAAAVAGGDVECAGVAKGRADIARRLPVVDAVHGQAVGDEALCLCEQSAAGYFHRRSGCTAQRLPKLSGSKDGVAVEEQRPCGVGVGHALQRGGVPLSSRAAVHFSLLMSSSADWPELVVFSTRRRLSI